MLQSEHGWQAQNQHSNLYVHGEDVSRAIDFINYYFNGNDIFQFDIIVVCFSNILSSCRQQQQQQQ